MIGPQTAFSQHLHGPDDRRKRFGEQVGNARRRGIPWTLTFDEWWAVWEASGKWPERGRLRGQFCMSRYGDTGAYAVGNVFIQGRCENDSEREAKKSSEYRRTYALRGSKHRWSILNEQQVEDIRVRLAAGEKGRAIAAEFGVLETTISNIKCGRTWRKLTDG
jgi:hypothetical protein